VSTRNSSLKTQRVNDEPKKSFQTSALGVIDSNSGTELIEKYLVERKTAAV
jgi:hypothetical protein